MVAAVAKLEPHTALKPAQVTMVANAKPPRTGDKNALAARNKSWEIPVRDNTLPIRINSGTTASS